MNDQYKMISNMLEDLQGQLETYDEMVNFTIQETYGLSIDVKKTILGLDMSLVDDMDASDVCKILKFENWIEDLRKLHGRSGGSELSEIDYAKYVIKDINKELIGLVEMRNQVIEFEKEKHEIAREYMEYLNSPEFKEKRQNQIKEIEDNIAMETDELKKRKLIKTLSTIKSLDSLSFLFNRFKSNEVAEKNSIIESFFNSSRGSYVISRYNQRWKSLKLSSIITPDFINLEERFLEKEYHVFNNLFVLFAIRYVAYVDKDNKDQVAFSTSLILNLHKLAYNEFTCVDELCEFKQVITGVLDYFKTDYDRFWNENETHPEHPVRIAKDLEKLQDKTMKDKPLITETDEMEYTDDDVKKNKDAGMSLRVGDSEYKYTEDNLPGSDGEYSPYMSGRQLIIPTYKDR